MNDDLISRQAAIHIASGYCHPANIAEELRKLPAAQPEPKKGKWIDKSGGIEGAWNYCSICGEQAIDLYDFCPNCGAKMEGTK